MATLYWVIYPAAQADPDDVAIINGTVVNGHFGQDESPVTDATFTGDFIEGLDTNTEYKLAAVWNDGVSSSNVVVTAAFFTTLYTVSLIVQESSGGPAPRAVSVYDVVGGEFSLLETVVSNSVTGRARVGTGALGDHFVYVQGIENEFPSYLTGYVGSQ